MTDLNQAGTLRKPATFLGFWKALGSLLILCNLIALGFAWQDRSWNAFAIAVVIAPAINAFFIVISLIATPFLKTERPRRAVIAKHILACIGIPLVTAAIDYYSIFAMGLHGC